MIWCVEDDENIRELEIYALKSAGFEARGFDTALSCWEALQAETPDLLILDVMLPGMDGWELLEKLRETPRFISLPVIMATVKGGEADKARTLDSGADDYLVKPFSMIELAARVRAVLRRCAKNDSVMQINGLVLDSERHFASLNGEVLALTYKEFKLLELFISYPGRVYNREQLLSLIWGVDYYRETRTVDMHIKTLRRKLGPLGSIIETVRNVGYRLSGSPCSE